MKTQTKMILFTILMGISTINFQTKAQSSENLSRATFSIETDPSTFAMNGYAMHLRYKPKLSQKTIIGFGIYALNLPDIMVNMNEDNKDKFWNVRINSSYALFTEYYFKMANKGVFLGLQAGVQNYKNTNSGLPNKDSKYSNFLLMPSIGYTWLPFKMPLYFKPWLGLGYTTKISGTNKIENLEYKIAPLVPFATLHIGYTFGK